MRKTPETLKLIWIKPERWSDLTEWVIDEQFSINNYLIPVGFLTDGGSIPLPMRGSFNPTGKGFLAFVCHDHRCKRNNYSRKRADKELYRDLKDCGVNRFRARAMYLGVRAYANATGKWT